MWCQSDFIAYLVDVGNYLLTALTCFPDPLIYSPLH